MAHSPAVFAGKPQPRSANARSNNGRRGCFLRLAFSVCYQRFGSGTGIACERYFEMFPDTWIADLANWLPEDPGYFALFGDDAPALQMALSIVSEHLKCADRRNPISGRNTEADNSVLGVESRELLPRHRPRLALISPSLAQL